MERKVIVIVGPTCSGKTSLSIQLANQLNGEIISADSRQIYKYLNIGTAKPSISELNSVPHHFIDLFDPNFIYDASKFEIDALKLIEEIFNRKKQPIVAGGSGLYMKALIDGLMNEVSTDLDYREYLYKKREQFGNQYLYDELLKVDPLSAEKMLPQNWKRVIRALEVYKLTGKSINEFHKYHSRNIDFQFLQFGLNWQRNILYAKIDKRVDEMINNGLVNEVDTILKMGFSNTLYSLNTVGYKEIIEFLESKITLERAVELIKRNTRRYAKKQLTWFNADSRINWMKIENSNQILELSDKIIKSINF